MMNAQMLSDFDLHGYLKKRKEEDNTQVCVFPKEGVIIILPIETSDGNRIFVKRKQPNYELEVTPPEDPTFKRLVINFGVYYLDGNGDPVRITQFDPGMELWVGYTALELDDYKLKYKHEYGDLENITITDRDPTPNGLFLGYARAEVETWPTDPNVGWV